MRRSLPVHNASRSSRLRILPVPVLGRGSLEKCRRRGILNFARRLSRNSRSCASSSCWPGFTTTQAAGTSPHCASGAETTAHSSTAGCAAIPRSTSMDEMFSPPLTMMSFWRSTMEM